MYLCSHFHNHITAWKKGFYQRKALYSSSSDTRCVPRVIHLFSLYTSLCMYLNCSFASFRWSQSQPTHTKIVKWKRSSEKRWITFSNPNMKGWNERWFSHILSTYSPSPVLPPYRSLWPRFFYRPLFQFSYGVISTLLILPSCYCDSFFFGRWGNGCMRDVYIYIY